MEKETFYIKVTEEGPYLVYGNPPVDQEMIVPNKDGKSWTYKNGKHFTPSNAPYALCRCGESKHAPFCDGSHKTATWNPRETTDFTPVLDNASITEGPDVILADNEKFCAYARFCDAHGTVWNLVKEKLDTKGKGIFKHEVEHCPSGRLIGWDKATGKIYEPKFDPSIGILEDPQIAISGPIWVKGGIRIESANGRSYEIRNRVTLCRCGSSSNKPFCDGTHASAEYYDGLGFEANGKEW
ncbi:MAG: CDGSH iron-sulfur domain-containing protein [Bacteroidales bacterium]